MELLHLIEKCVLKGHAGLYVVRKIRCVFVCKRKEDRKRWEGEGGRKRKKWGDVVCVCVW